MNRTLPVGLGARTYDVVVGHGLLDSAGSMIAPLQSRGRTAVVSDETVWALHGARLTAALAAAEIATLPIIIAPGEQSKSFEGLADVSDRLLALELDRGDLVTAFGGGVVGDLAGFAAAIYKRGIDFVQFPTTLLAQVDSSVGGKTAIDTARGKNLIGAFHQPRLVLADLDVLGTLPIREMRAGYAEVIKYGLLGDSLFFEWLEVNGAAVIARDPVALSHAVARCIEMKAEIVADALEAETGYGEELRHGEAVGAGMALALRFSAAQGLLAGQDAERACRAIAAVSLPTRLAEVPGHPFNAARLVAHMAQDKKAEAGRLTFILARALGDAFVAHDISASDVHRFLRSEGATA